LRAPRECDLTDADARADANQIEIFGAPRAFTGGHHGSNPMQ